MSLYEEYQFCSREEVIERQKNGDVHILEATIETADPKLPISSRIMDRARAVKKFTRSGSSDLHKTYESRSRKQLSVTSRYLICDVWWSTFTSRFHERSPSPRYARGIDISAKYTFVMDRLQSVRQDITSSSMFNSDPVAVADLLKLLVHFYVHSMHIISAPYCTPADGNRYTVDDGRSPLKSKSSHPVTSWFDLHSHESALSSCLTTALGSCRQLPLIQQLSVKNIRDELSAYSVLLSVARQLRNLFQGIFSNYSSASYSALSQHSAALSLMKSLLLKFSVLGSDSLNTLRELYSVDAAIGSSDMHNAGGNKTPSLELPQISLKCLSSIRQCNPASAVRAFLPAARTTARQCTSDTEGASLDCSISRTQRVVLAALLHQLLPELRLLRFLQCDTVANKDDMLALPSLAARLWLPSRANIPLTSSQVVVIHEAALLLGIRVTSTGASVAADICTAGSQLDCAVLKASVCASGAEKNPSAPLDRSQRNEPDSQLKARAVLMGLMNSCPGESAQGEGTGSSSASNSDSTDLTYDSKITWPGQETNAHDKHPMRADEIISVLRDLLHEAREEDWFGSSQPLDHHK